MNLNFLSNYSSFGFKYPHLLHPLRVPFALIKSLNFFDSFENIISDNFEVLTFPKGTAIHGNRLPSTFIYTHPHGA